MFDTLLIANRGEIAVRIARTARRLGIRTLAVYSDADRDALHVAEADEAFRIGPAPAAESYLDGAAIIAAARRGGAQAVHPGYGFLSENPGFVEAVEAAGLVFVGPPAAAIRAMGLKDTAKSLMEAAGVPVVPGYHGGEQDPAALAREAGRIGFPVLIKAAAGGGGRGMRRVAAAEDFALALAAARREALSAFGDDRVLVERCLVVPRHIEIQVFADAHGGAVHLFERDCSLQRRHQKVIEEAPAPGMSPAMRDAMGEAAVRAARAVGYEGAGTVEFIADVSEGLRPDRFYFMEMNTRLQVEHPVTEAITGLDLVEWQLRVAAGEPLPKRQDEIAIGGHAVEARLYAEDPARDFMPQTGRLTALAFGAGPGVRVDAGVREGDGVTPFYDAMIAKVVAHGPDRATALARLRAALAASRVEGCTTNLAFLGRLLALPAVQDGTLDTGLIPREIDALLAEPVPSGEEVALAMLGAAGLLQAPASPDPFVGLAGFRHWGAARRDVEVATGAQRRRGTVVAEPGGRFRVEEGGATVRLRVLGREGEALRVEIDGHVVSARVEASDETVLVRTAAGTARFALAGQGLGAAEEDPSRGVVRAVMPGVVRVVHVELGQTVARGDALLVTEAMKMEMTLAAPRAGRVASVDVAAGDRVEVGAVLVTLEAAAD